MKHFDMWDNNTAFNCFLLSHALNILNDITTHVFVLRSDTDAKDCLRKLLDCIV